MRFRCPFYMIDKDIAWTEVVTERYISFQTFKPPCRTLDTLQCDAGAYKLRAARAKEKEKSPRHPLYLVLVLAIFALLEALSKLYGFKATKPYCSTRLSWGFLFALKEREDDTSFKSTLSWRGKKSLFAEHQFPRARLHVTVSSGLWCLAFDTADLSLPHLVFYTWRVRNLKTSFAVRVPKAQNVN